MLEELGTELLRSGYSVRFHASGQSMNPTIRDGEAITVEPIAPEDVRRGDIILYRTAKGFIAHRVLLINVGGGAARNFVLRGDASVTCDALITFEQILGKVTYIGIGQHKREVNISNGVTKLRLKFNQILRGVMRETMLSHNR